MFQRQDDRVGQKIDGDKTGGPTVDMANARDVRQVFRSDGQNRSDVIVNGQLNFDDPNSSSNIYGSSDSSSNHHSHHETHKHHCHGDSPGGSEQNNVSSQDRFEQNIQAQIKSLESQIQYLLDELNQDSGITNNTAGDPISRNSPSSSSGDSTITNNFTTGASGSAGDGVNLASGGSSDSTSSSSATAASAPLSGAAIDQVMAQSPNAAGPLNFDSAVNNASVVGFVGPAAGATVDRNAQIEFKDMKSYVHLKTGGWVQIEDQKNSEIIGGNWKDDMKGDSQPMTVQNGQNDAVMTAPPAGWVDHFWLHDGGGTIDPSKVDGFFSTTEAKASVPNSGLAASLGVDWFKPDGSSDGRFGGSTTLTDQWQTLYHTTLDRQTLEKDPPPGLTATGADSATAAGSQTASSGAPTDAGGNSHGAKLIDLFPQTDAQWQRITNNAPQGSLIVTESASDVNPKYDTTFNSIDPALKQHIDYANAAGMKTLGYVGTANGTKSLAVAEAEIDDWYKNAQVAGIYLGNSGKAYDSGYATDPASEQYFETLANYIKAKGGMAVINGSGTPNPDYAQYFDVQGTVEDSAKNYAKFPEAAWQSNYSADHFSAVLGDVPLSDLKQVEAEMLAKNNGYIAVADTYPAPMTDQYWQAQVDYLNQ